MGKNAISKVNRAKRKAEKGFRRIRMAMASVAHLADEEYSCRVRAEQMLSEIERIVGKDFGLDITLVNRVRAIALLARTRQTVDTVQAGAKPFAPEAADELKEAHEALDKAGMAHSGNAPHSKAINLTRLTAVLRIEELVERNRRLESQNEQLRAAVGKTKKEMNGRWHKAFRDSGIAITHRGPVEAMELLKNREANVLCIAKEGCAKTAEEAACSECRTSVGKAVRDRQVPSKEIAQ